MSRRTCSGSGVARAFPDGPPTRKIKMRKKMKKNWGKMREATEKWGKNKEIILSCPPASERLCSGRVFFFFFFFLFFFKKGDIQNWFIKPQRQRMQRCNAIIPWQPIVISNFQIRRFKLLSYSLVKQTRSYNWNARIYFVLCAACPKHSVLLIFTSNVSFLNWVPTNV